LVSALLQRLASGEGAAQTRDLPVKRTVLQFVVASASG
jgi:hypothetical protein